MLITSLDKDEQEFFKAKYGLTHKELFEVCKLHSRSGMSHCKVAKVVQARKIEKELQSANTAVE